MKTKSIGINFSGYPASASNFIIDNGCLVLIDALLNNGHDTVLFDYNTPKTIDFLKIGPDTQASLDAITERILSIDNPDHGLLTELNAIETDIESFREKKVREMSQSLVDYCKLNKIDFVWMKIWSGDGFRYSNAMAEEIKKELPDIKIIGGGHHVRLFREHTFKFAKAFDVLVYSDGEKTLPMIADWVKGNRDLESIPGTLYQSNGTVIDTKGDIFSTPAELNKMLVPKDFLAHYESHYMGLEQKILIGLTETSRGCPEYHDFCQHSINCGTKWRKIDPEIVVENFQTYHENEIYANRIPDSNPPIEHLKEIYRQMKKQNLRGNSITAFCEIPQFDLELAQLFKDVGGYCLFFGIESGSYDVLKKIRKFYKPEESAKKIQMAKDLGILVVTSFMVPTIGDNEDTIRETENWIRQVQPHCWPIGPTVPMGKMLSNPEKYGYELSDDYLDILQFYSPKLHMPPQLGGSLPVKKDGKDWDELKAISGALMNRLKGVGVPLVSDEITMLAFLAKMHPKAFNTSFTEALRKGDSDRIRDYTSTINQNVRNPYHYYNILG